MNIVFKSISYIFHPLFLVVLMLWILMTVNPYLFGITNSKAEGLLLISVFSMSVMFPLISVLLMKGLGLIRTIHMREDKERVGPLIATSIFYLWLYINIKNNNLVPQAFSFFVLGTTIAIFLAFFISNFSKISLHTIGMGGFLMGLILVRYNFTYDSFAIKIGSLNYLIQMDFLIILVILLTGLVGTARLYLKEHDKEQVYGGYLVGVFSQNIAFAIFF